MTRALENVLLIPNTPVGPLSAGETYVGRPIECYQWNTLIVSMKTDVDGTLYIELSSDGDNWDSTVMFEESHYSHIVF